MPVELEGTVELAALAPPSLVSLPPHALLPQPAGRPLLVLRLLLALLPAARLLPALLPGCAVLIRSDDRRLQ